MHNSDLIAAALALALAGASATRAQDPVKPPGASPVPAAPASGEAGKPVELASSDLGGLDTLLPVGKSARKVVVPSIDQEGALLSVTRMGKITRIDEHRFVLENVILTSFDPRKPDPATGNPETTVVRISKGVYFSPEKKLVSDRPVRISKPRLEMIGESLIYWSVQGHAVLKGHTEAILTDLPAPPDPAETQEADAPEPDAPEPDAPEPDAAGRPTPQAGATAGPRAGSRPATTPSPQ